MPRLNLATLACLSILALLLTGCSTTQPTTEQAVWMQSPDWKLGPWALSPAKFPDRLLEVTFEPEYDEHTIEGCDIHGPRPQRHYFAYTESVPNGRFTIASAEGIALTVTASYYPADGVFAREKKKGKDYYSDMKWRWEDGHFVMVVDPNSSALKLYAGGTTISPVHETVVFAALRNGQTETVLATDNLIEIAQNERDPLGRSLLYRAAQLDNKEVVVYLLDHGVPADIRNSTGLERTPLGAAIDQSNLEIIDLLLDAGADPNLPDSVGSRPLHIAGQSCGEYRQIVRRLLEAGANPELTNKRHETPRQRLEHAGADGFLPILDEELAAYQKKPS